MAPTTALETSTGRTLTPALADLATEANGHATRARSERTLDAYRRDWERFTAWCDTHSLDPMPADVATIVLYVTDTARTLKPSTIRRHLASISVAHQTNGQTSPTKATAVAEVMKGIVRDAADKATADGERSLTRQAAALDYPKLAATVARIETDTRQGLRDRALLLIGFAGYFRRSELCDLTVSRIEQTTDGLALHLPTSKTDQEGRGTIRPIPHGSTDLDPVAALTAWLDAAQITDGPVFRNVNRHGHIGDKLTGRSVARIVKARAAAAGIDPAAISGHSLRRGAATTAARRGASSRQIADAGGWERGSKVLERYVDTSRAIADAPDLGL